MIELAIYQIDAFTHERFKGNPAAVVGDIAVVRREDGLLEMSFPNRAPEPVAEPPQVLLAALNLVPECVLRNRQAWFVVCADEEQVRAATKPDTACRPLLGFAALSANLPASARSLAHRRASANQAGEWARHQQRLRTT